MQIIWAIDKPLCFFFHHVIARIMTVLLISLTDFDTSLMILDSSNLMLNLTVVGLCLFYGSKSRAEKDKEKKEK